MLFRSFVPLWNMADSSCGKKDQVIFKKDDKLFLKGDVYKRQGLVSVFGNGNNVPMRIWGIRHHLYAVSYTHLDVYKRQVIVPLVVPC